MAISVCVLLYGPHPDLARRVLGSIVASRPPADVVADLRIGLNAVCPESREQAFLTAGTQLLHLPVTLYEPPYNVGKYPLMRRMFYDTRRPLAEHVMWFDDDSYITAADGDAWWRQVLATASEHAVTGQVWRIQQRGRQYLGIQAQPWYGNMPIGMRHKFRFCTGGWWVARSDFLRRWDYPFLEVFHNGGDSILGELVRQQRESLFDFDAGVKINEGGRPGRRGIAVALRDEVYPWQNYQPGRVPDMTKHQFECLVHSFALQDNAV